MAIKFVIETKEIQEKDTVIHAKLGMGGDGCLVLRIENVIVGWLNPKDKPMSWKFMFLNDAECQRLERLGFNIVNHRVDSILY